MNEGYVYDEIKHAGQILHKQYTDQMLKYEFDVQLMAEHLGIEEAESFLLNLIDKAPKFIQPYADLCVLYFEFGRTEEELAAIEAAGFVMSKSLVVDKDGNFPDLLEWGYMENRPIIRFLNMGAEELWEEDDLDAAKELYEGLLRSNWMDNIGARYCLLAIYQGMSFEDYDNNFEAEDGLGKDIDKWFGKGFKKYPLLVEWEKQIEQFM
jgi:tetratricopeptide (TPR) repeat protein